jgi:prevent-host-death family protein
LKRPQYRLRVDEIMVFYDVTERDVEVLAIITKREAEGKRVHQPRKIALAKVKDDLSRYLRQAAIQEIVITRHGRPAGVLIGFGSEDDWFEYRLENHPEFLRRIQAAREAIRAGEGVRLADVPR